MLFGQRTLLVRARRTDKLQAHRFGPLAGNQPDSAGCRVEQNEIIALQTALWLCAAQQVLHGQALEHHGGAGLKTDRIRQLADAFGRHHAHLAVAAGRLAGIGSAVACLQVRNAFANGLHNARRLHAQAQRHRQLVQPAALIHVDEIKANRFVANADFAGARLANSDIDQLELFGASVLVDNDGFGGDGCHRVIFRLSG